MRDYKRLLLPTVGTVGGILFLVTGQGAGWIMLVLSAALYGLYVRDVYVHR